ncbi:hypothetical protein [Microbispora bryophytorum]|uniref:hypothetical protein n=1 Tax=Microbispora bryophytorum TaxID=1460882 RepID=UPI0033E8D4F4
MAGNGWMRGVQDMRSPLRYVLAGNAISTALCPALVYGLGWGIDGSAVATVAGQLISASLFVRAPRGEGVPLARWPSPPRRWSEPRSARTTRNGHAAWPGR